MPTITDESSRVVAPALPTGPTTYSKGYIDRFNNILRLYFNQLDNALRNAVATSVPYTLRVAQGQITGATSLFKFGFNGDVDTSEETVWSEGGNLTYPGAAAEMYLSSSDTNDAAPSGTGVRTVKIQGLDANYLQIEEDVSLNGQTQVVTTKEFLRVYRVYALTSGSNGGTAGTVYVGTSGETAGVPSTVYASFGDANQTEMATYTVPASKTLYINNITFTAVMSAATNSVTAKFTTRESATNTFRTQFIQVLESNNNVSPFEYPLAIPAKTDIECRAIATTTNNQVSASFDGVLIDS
jgi:hypothetical protein